MTHISSEIMWEAVVNHRAEYDGVFYYGVSSTRIFCRPSCKSRQPHRYNVSFFKSTEDALREGYRPCKRCRPDLPAELIPSINRILDKVTDILTSEYSNPSILSELPSLVGVSAFHLQRSYKHKTGYTPKARLQEIRIKKAMELMSDKNKNNTEICFMVGFQSLSSFYAAFRSITGYSPGEFKRYSEKGSTVL